MKDAEDKAGPVLILIDRPEGYEDVHPDIVLDDFRQNPGYFRACVAEAALREAYASGQAEGFASGRREGLEEAAKLFDGYSVSTIIRALADRDAGGGE